MMKNLEGRNIYNNFTIQNVPIKSKATKNRIPASRTFTIQNVPIKLASLSFLFQLVHSLQYKMFLLNISFSMIFCFLSFLYNTKCSY